MSYGIRTHRSDNGGYRSENFRVGRFRGGFHDKIGNADVRQTARLAAQGAEIYDTQSRLCVCGAVALRVWHNVGYCKAHAPERV